MRKLCTRQHFIEYLSLNFVERQCLMARCLWERYLYDYGIDGFVTPVNELGEVEVKFMDIQVKATERLHQLKGSGEFVFDLSKNDIENWLNSQLLVLLVVYEASLDIAYYIDVAEYFRKNRHVLSKANKFVRVYFTSANVFDQRMLEQFKQSK